MAEQVAMTAGGKNGRSVVQRMLAPPALRVEVIALVAVLFFLSRGSMSWFGVQWDWFRAFFGLLFR